MEETRSRLFRCIAVLLAAMLTGLTLSVWAVKPVWKPDQPLTPASDSRAVTSARSVAADSAGAVHVLWEDTRAGQTHITYRRSPDHGVSWGPEQRLSGGGINARPSIAAAEALVYAVWETSAADQPVTVQLSRSSNGGSTWSSPTGVVEGMQASLAVVGSPLHLIYVGMRGAEAKTCYRRSPDGGLSWENERVLSATAGRTWTPSIAAAGNLVASAWVDTRDGNEEAYVAVSSDAGQTWGKESRLTKNRLSSGPPSIAVAGQTIHLVWADQKANGDDLSDAERQLDEIMRLIGLSFTSESIRKTQANVFDTDALQARIEHKRQQVQAAVPIWGARGGDPVQIGAMLHEVDRVVKIATHEWDIYYRRSDDGGQKWRKEIRLTDAPGASWQPGIGATGSMTHIVWSDDRDGAPAVYYASSLNGGESWTPQIRLTDAAGVVEQPSIAVSTDATHIFWADSRNGPPQVFYKRLKFEEK